jgi:hypothetical protein
MTDKIVDRPYTMWCKTDNKYNEEIVTIESSDEEDVNYNNNNDEKSPYKNKHNKKNETPLKDSSRKNEESDDEVIFVGEDTLELEALSKIDTLGNY